MRIRHLLCAIALVLVVDWSPAAGAADPVTLVDLATYSAPATNPPRSSIFSTAIHAARAHVITAIEAAINPDTGGLAVVVPRQGTVILFPKFVESVGKKAEPVVAKVGGFPCGIVYKKFADKAYFVVACHLSNELVLLDATTLKLEKTIAVKLGRPHSVISSLAPKDPFVYYTIQAGAQARRPNVFGWVNLNTGADESPMNGIPAEDLAISADGKRLFTRYARSVNTLEAPDPGARGKAPVVKQTTMPPGGPWFVADPRGEYLIADRVWSLKDAKEAAKLSVYGCYASPTAPVLFGIDPQYKHLVAVSTNSLRAVGAVKLALESREGRTHKEVEVREQDGVTVAAPRLQVLEDPMTKTVLLVSGRKVRLVPLAEFLPPGESVLAVEFGGPLDFPVGRRHEVKVIPTVAGASVELASGPVGMKLEGGMLTWSPGESAVGFYPVTLRLSAKGASRTVSVTVQARGPSLVLPFEPIVYGDPTDPGFGSNLPTRPRYLSPDGSAAVFLGWERMEGRNPPINRVAVVNLDKLTIEAERKLLVGAANAALDDRHVFVGLAESDAVKVLARKDLSDKGVAYTDGRPADVVPVGNFFVTTAWKHNRLDPYRTEAFDAVSLKPRPFGAAIKAEPGATPQGVTIAPVPVAGGWWHDGAVFDAKFDKVRAVIQPRGFWTWDAKRALLRTDQKADLPLWDPKLGEGRWYTPWGVSVRDFQLLSNGVRVGFIPSSAGQRQPKPRAIPVVLPDHPAVACLELSQPLGRDNRSVVRAEVTFYDLTSAEVGAAILLSERPVDPAAPIHSTALRLAPCPGGKLVAVVGREVFVLKVPEFTADKFPRPLHFTPDFPATVVSLEEVSVPLPAAGGKGPFTFALVNEVQGVRVDQQTGKLVIAPRDLVAELTEQIAGAAKKGQGETTLKNYRASVGPWFERLTGKKPTGIPIWVPVSVAVEDRLLGKATGQFGYFVDVPMAGIWEKLGVKP
jgi:hypothetical protein